MNVFNPPNAEPLVLERTSALDFTDRPGGPAAWIHTKALYSLTPEATAALRGVTDDMRTTSWMPRGLNGPGSEAVMPPQ